MSFTEQLERELKARAVRPAVRRRIMLEYADHLASDEESGAADSGAESRAKGLGDPAELAGQFAAELAADDARRTTRNTFLALSATAVALVVGQLAIGHAGGYRGPGNGRSLALWIPAILAILCAPQVALVSGLLAGARGLLRRGSTVLPDAEVALLHRRCLTGAGAGLVTCAGLVLYVVNFSGELAGWWVWTQAAMATAAAVALGLAIRGSLRSRTTVGGIPGEPVELVDQAGRMFGAISPPPGLRTHPQRVVALVAAAVVLATTLFTAHAEGSLVEGLERGAFEALFIVLGLALSRCCAARWRFR